MRRYRILITNPTTGKVLLDYNSVNTDGTDNPAALDVVLDVPVVSLDLPAGNTYVRVWGIPLSVISQATDLFGMSIQVWGGMSKSYPLNNAQQFGILIEGSIFQAFGNWIGTDQTLDIVLTPFLGTLSNPLNLVLNWPKGMNLQTALTNTFQTALPGLKLKGTLSPNLVQDHDDHAVFKTLPQLATWVNGKSRSVIAAYYARLGNQNSTYRGVQMTVNGPVLKLFDGTTPTRKNGPANIAFTDLIGQPTWIDLQTMQLTCVMRADLSVGDQITMPKSQITTTANANAQFRQSSVFQGTLTVTSIRHVGAFRQPDAKSWVTVINAVMNA